MYKRFLKPIFDICVALPASLILSPFFIIIALAIKLESKGPVFFRQPRLGHHGKVFKINKFRSMITDQRKFGRIIKIYESDPRITRIGRFLRKTSLDELPQLYNILKGEMSIIGPRPPLPHFPKKYEEYTEFEKQRFSVKPGISGLAQVKHREIHDWDVNIPIDVEYVQNYSFMYDLKLFFASLVVFFKPGDVYRRD